MINHNFLHRKQCPICGSSKVEEKLHQPLSDPALWAYLVRAFKTHITPADVEGVDFKIAHCPICEFYFVVDIPTEAFETKLNNFWRDTGPAVSVRQQSQKVRYFADYALEAEKIAVILDRKPYGIEVLEFGSGNGHWLIMAKAHGYTTTGVEIRDDRIAYARKNGLFIVRSLDELEGRQFDFIRADLVLEHLADPLQYLRALAAHLRPTGYMRVGVPEGDEIYKVLSRYNGTPEKLIGPYGHINCFTYNALIALAAKTGLKPLPVAMLRKAYLKAMWDNRDTKYIGEFLKAGRKQHSCTTLYLHKS